MTSRPPGVRAATQVGIYGAAQVAQALLALGLVALLARAMGRAGFGQFSFAFVVASLGGLIADFGLGPWLTRAVAQEPGRTSDLLRDVLGLRLRLLAVAWIVTLGGCALYFRDPFRVESVAAMLAYLTAMGYVGIWESLLMGRGRVGRVSISVSGGKALELGAVGLALLLGMRAEVPRVAAALALGTLLRLGLVSTLARPLLREGSSLAGAAPAEATAPIDTESAPVIPPGDAALSPTSPAAGTAFLLQVLPFALGAWMWTAYFKVDVLILERLATPVGLGLYTAAYRVIEALLLLPRTVVGVTFPRVAADWTGSRLANGVPSGPGRALLLVSLAASVGLWVLAEPIMSFLFGVSFAEGASALRVLAIAVPVLFANQYLGMVLPATHRQNTWVALLVGALVVNVAANLLLIPRLGFVGAAWATLASEIFLLCGNAVLVARRHGGMPGPSWIARAVIAAIGMGLGVHFVPGPLVVRIGTGAVLFAALALLMGTISASERGIARSLVLRGFGRGIPRSDRLGPR